MSISALPWNLWLSAHFFILAPASLGLQPYFVAHVLSNKRFAFSQKLTQNSFIFKIMIYLFLHLNFCAKKFTQKFLFYEITIKFLYLRQKFTPRCMKITKKVSYKIASEASYVYILSGQQLIKIPKWSILTSFWKPGACGQTVFQDRSVLIWQKLVENAKIQMRHIE